VTMNAKARDMTDRFDRIPRPHFARLVLNGI
jgi:hypothetical protein